MATNIVEFGSTKLNWKQITLPDVYREAVRLIKETIDLDESKQWVDKSEALVAWAHMYNENELGVEAKRLRLHAFKRMGELARELQPVRTIRGGGRTPGPLALLREAGLSRHNAQAAVFLSKLSKAEEKRIIDEDEPLSPQTYQNRSFNQSKLAHYRGLQRTPFSCRVFLRETTPQRMVELLDEDELKAAAAQMRKLAKWATEFARLCK